MSSARIPKPRGERPITENSEALLLLAFLCAMVAGIDDKFVASKSREMAWSAFEDICLDLMPDRTSIIRHAAAQGWQTLAEGEEIDPPNRSLRGPHRSWRIDEGDETIILGIEILGDRATAEQMLAGENSGGFGLLFCKVHFEGGNNEDIARDISSLSIEGRPLGRPQGLGGGPDGWTNRIWGVGRGGFRIISLSFDPDGNGRFIEVSAEIRG